MASLTIPHQPLPNDAPRHSQECAIRHGESCDCTPPTYEDLLFYAMQKIRIATDYRSQKGTREQDNRLRNSLLNHAKDLISLAQERL